MKDLALTFEVLSESDLAFNVVDISAQEQILVVGDVETIVSHIVEQYIASKVKIWIAKTDLGRLIGQSIEQQGYKVEYLGCIPEDSLVQASVIRQKPFIIVNPTSKPSIYLKHIVGRIEKTEPEINEGVSTFLKKFLGKKKS